MKKLLGMSVIMVFVVCLMVIRYTDAKQNPVGFSLSGTDCSAHVSPITDGASESTISEVECTVSLGEIEIDQSDASSRHCVGRISPVQKDDNVSKVRSVNCFATFTHAIEHASDGAVQLDSSITPETLTQAMLDAQATTASTIIGVMWEHATYATPTGTRTWTWTTTDSRVCNGASYAFTTMPNGWDNSVRSAHAYNNCTSYENYEHTSFGGLSIDCRPACPAMGSMNDRTSSWRIHNQ